MELKQHIISEIQRIASKDNGKPPGRRVFENETGIKPSQWRGVIWARWGDALLDAGFSPNERQGKLDTDFVLSKLAEAVRHFGAVPTNAELRIYGRNNPKFPGHSTLSNHFRNKAEMALQLRRWAEANCEHELLPLIPDVQESAQIDEAKPSTEQEGFVYLLSSGSHFKIGQSNNLERRVKEVTIALPEPVTLVHAIRTDDPSGIESYWHRRFSDKRANGEWFSLTAKDVAAFKKRKFQ